MAGELRNGNVIPWTNGELIYKYVFSRRQIEVTRFSILYNIIMKAKQMAERGCADRARRQNISIFSCSSRELLRKWNWRGLHSLNLIVSAMVGNHVQQTDKSKSRVMLTGRSMHMHCGKPSPCNSGRMVFNYNYHPRGNTSKSRFFKTIFCNFWK